MIEATVSKYGMSVSLTIDGGPGDTAELLVNLAMEKLKELKSDEY